MEFPNSSSDYDFNIDIGLEVLEKKIEKTWRRKRVREKR